MYRLQERMPIDTDVVQARVGDCVACSIYLYHCNRCARSDLRAVKLIGRRVHGDSCSISAHAATYNKLMKLSR